MALGNKRALLYDKLHKIAFFSILGLSAVTATLLGYNIYLFKIGINISFFTFIYKLLLFPNIEKLI